MNNTEFHPAVLAIIQAVYLVGISQAIIAGFNPVRIIWDSVQNVINPGKQKGIPILMVPLVCAPCFSFWSTLIAGFTNPIWIGYLPVIGTASFAFLFSKVIHILTNRK